MQKRSTRMLILEYNIWECFVEADANLERRLTCRNQVWLFVRLIQSSSAYDPSGKPSGWTYPKIVIKWGSSVALAKSKSSLIICTYRLVSTPFFAKLVSKSELCSFADLALWIILANFVLTGGTPAQSDTALKIFSAWYKVSSKRMIKRG